MTGSIKLESRIICPECGYSKEEAMPTDSCQFFYECTKCATVLKPQKGDCCVFRSYGSVVSPIQGEQKSNCCS